MFASEVADGVLQVRRPGTRWLSTGGGGAAGDGDTDGDGDDEGDGNRAGDGAPGGYETADAAYNCTVPEGFARTDLVAYAAERRAAAGFGPAGPTMLTGVAMDHARRARLGSVEVVATVGLSNPAALPVDSTGGPAEADDAGDDDRPRVGTVNLAVGTTRSLGDGTLATLLATAVEAKTATLLALAGFPGTTSDAVVVGSDPAGEPAAFAGSATEVGRAARVCVRDAVRASLGSRYGDESVPESVADAEYGVVAAGRADVSRVE